MMDSFQRQLKSEFDGRFRVRFSERSKSWQVEYKVQPGQVLEPPRNQNGEWDTYDDDWIRARDGYDFIVEVRPGDRMPCPICGLDIKLTPLEMQESVCTNCMLHGRDGRVRAVFYPLNHILIEHLRFIDPLRDGARRAAKAVRERQKAKEEADFKNNLDQIDEVNKEFFPKFYDIKSWGYRGATPYWEQ